MAECFLGGAGGSKIYAMADCAFDNSTTTFTFPTGVTWENIEILSIMSGGSSSSSAAIWAAKTGANTLTVKGTNSLTTYTISDSATSFTVSQYSLGSPTHAIVVV